LSKIPNLPNLPNLTDLTNLADIFILIYITLSQKSIYHHRNIEQRLKDKFN